MAAPYKNEAASYLYDGFYKYIVWKRADIVVNI